MECTIIQSTQFLKISLETWAIAAATIIGPLSAVLITRWRDNFREVRVRRLWIFRTLLATRKVAINIEHVTALNLIEVDFFGIKKVEEAWKAYNAHLNSAPTDRQMTTVENKDFENKRTDLLAKLLFSIGVFLGFTMSEIDLKNGGYAPVGWQHRDARITDIQKFALSMAAGKSSFPIHIVPNQPSDSNP